MINMMKLDYSPKCVSWIYKKGQPDLLVAVWVYIYVLQLLRIYYE